jgi:toxin FitB
MLCDSNIVIYAAEPNEVMCNRYLKDPSALIASVTRIEVLGFPRFAELSPERQIKLQTVVASTVEAPLDEEIIEKAIVLRQQKKMGLGDAIIAATALEYGLPLVTRNEDDFKHISGLKIINPFAQG